MPALTADRNTPYKDGELIHCKVAAGVKCYAGGIAVLEAGYCRPGKDAADLVYVGRFEEQVDNTGGAAGAKTVLVRRGKAFLFKNDVTNAVVQADVGDKCQIVDDQTVARNGGGVTAANRSDGGQIIGVDDGGVWVF